MRGAGDGLELRGWQSVPLALSWCLGDGLTELCLAHIGLSLFLEVCSEMVEDQCRKQLAWQDGEVSGCVSFQEQTLLPAATGFPEKGGEAQYFLGLRTLSMKPQNASPRTRSANSPSSL